MGYKLAGYDVIGVNEIDPKIAELYEANHRPRLKYVEDIRLFNERKDLPVELFDLDVLDGSPPCSTFSMNGDREKDWGKGRKFREGQADQTLDDLFMRFLDTVEKLRPRIVICENVKGMILGVAKGYASEVLRRFESLGYDPQLFLLNAASMGVPQKRERVFFLARRRDLGLPPIDMGFSERPIPYGEFCDAHGDPMTEGGTMRKWWGFRRVGDRTLAQAVMRETGKNAFFSQQFLARNRVANTVTTSARTCLLRFDEPSYATVADVIRISSFPMDYDFCCLDPAYVCGMSVPPVMMAQVAWRVRERWLSKLPKRKKGSI